MPALGDIVVIVAALFVAAFFAYGLFFCYVTLRRNRLMLEMNKEAFERQRDALEKQEEARQWSKQKIERSEALLHDIHSAILSAGTSQGLPTRKDA